MNFRDLEYVVELARTLNFSRAAERCHVSQPSLSAQIRKLETELQAELFIRTNKRSIHLSAFGEAFVEKAITMLSLRDDVIAMADAGRNPMEGTIRLGAILTVAPYLFPHLFNTVQAQAPKIKLHLKEAKTEELMTLLLTGKIDAAIVSLPVDEGIFDTHTLFTDPFYLAVPKGHDLAGLGQADAQSLDRQKLILLDDGHCFRDQALEICHSTTAMENKHFKATSLETIRRFVATGQGVTLMPGLARHRDDSIVYIPFQDKRFTREIGVIYRKASHKKHQIEHLIRLIDRAMPPE